MGVLLLVRHGQASFGADDYDVLSETGWEQGRVLGRWLADNAPAPASVVHGGMRRHRETWEAMLEGAQAAVELFLGARSDDRRGDCGLREKPGQPEVGRAERGLYIHSAGIEQDGVVGLAKGTFGAAGIDLVAMYQVFDDIVEVDKQIQAAIERKTQIIVERSIQNIISAVDQRARGEVDQREGRARGHEGRGECAAEEEPRSTTALPDFSASAAASIVTFGRAS